jgi:hypothetical protein
MDEMERKFKLEARAMELLALIAVEFKSDPASVQCFDLRLVQEVIQIADEYPKLRPLF